MDKFLINKETSKAEILYVLNLIKSNASFNSAKYANNLFKTMFSDSSIAQSFCCGPSKVSYTSTFGLGPYFEDKLYDILEKVPIYTVSFDESYNKVTNKEQMDFNVRYWDDSRSQIVNRYLGSQFLGHTTAGDLLSAFNEGTRRLDESKMLQIGMDGPNSNLRFLKDLNLKRDSKDLPKLIDIGTCGLHVIHGAFRAGFTATGWKIDSILKSLFYVFDESPARRADFTTYTGCEVFPLSFCGTRWIDDRPVAERAIELWPHVTKYVNIINSGPKSKIPKCASYLILSKAINDSTALAKLNVFVNIAKDFEPFLTKFQSNAPLVPFLNEELGLILKSLLEMFVKPSVIQSSKYIADLIKIDIEDTSNYLPTRKVCIGFASSEYLKRIDISEAVLSEFKLACQMCYKTIVVKLFKRGSSPCNYKLVSDIICLSPRYMINHPNSTIDKFEAVLSKFVHHKFVKMADGDDIMKQYKNTVKFMKEEKKKECGEYVCGKSKRIDEFFFELLGNLPEYGKL